MSCYCNTPKILESKAKKKKSLNYSKIDIKYSFYKYVAAQTVIELLVCGFGCIMV